MAAVNGSSTMHDKSAKKNKPFAWMSKKIASLRSANNGGKRPKRSSEKATSTVISDDPPRLPSQPAQEPLNSDPDALQSYPAGRSAEQNENFTSLGSPEVAQDAPLGGSHSAAPTLATNPDTINSDAGKSRAETATTGGPAVSTISGGGGGNSIFSSSNHSARSLTTTLTTIQSTAPGQQITQHTGTGTAAPVSPSHTSHPSQSSTYFSQPYPTTPASAVPSHLNPPANPGFVPSSYRSAVANGLLSDNASVLTLASSSQMNQRRRNSLDTNASVRAIAPSSQWGGSRESLPLSVLSQSNDAASGPSVTPTISQQQRPSVSGLASAERASVYSSSGVNAPALSSERNSVYAGKSGNRDTADGASIKGQEDSRSMRSGMLGHGRNDSIAGSIGGLTSASTLATPKDAQAPATTGEKEA